MATKNTKRREKERATASDHSVEIEYFTILEAVTVIEGDSSSFAFSYRCVFSYFSLPFAFDFHQTKSSGLTNASQPTSMTQ